MDWLAPRIGPIGSTVTVTGRGLCNGTVTVTVGGVAATSVNCASGYTLNFTIPSTTSGAKTVAITNDGGSVSVSSAFTVQVQAAGNTKYISPTGNDSTGIGTSLNPWRTCQFAITQVSPGDTILLKNGTYSNHCSIRNISGTINALITIRPENAGQVTWQLETIQGCETVWTCGGDDDRGTHTSMIDMKNASYWEISGIFFSIQVRNLPSAYAYGVVCYGTCTGLRWKDNIVEGNNLAQGGGRGFLLDSATGANFDNLIEGNTIRNIRDGETIAITLAGDNCGGRTEVGHALDPACFLTPQNEYTTVRNNTINGTGNGDGFQNGPATSHHMLVEGNTFVGNVKEENCIDSKAGDWITVRNNTCSNYTPVISNSNGDAMLFQMRHTGVVIEGNTIYASGMGMNFGTGCCDNQAPTDVRIARNLIFGMVKTTVIDSDGLPNPALGQSLAHALQVNGDTDVEIINNTFAQNQGACIALSGGTGIVVKNNICYNAPDGMIAEQGHASVTVGKNIFYNAGGERFVCCTGDLVFRTLAQYQAFTGQAVGSINTDPQFINPTLNNDTRDYHLSAGSPGIDLGEVVTGVTETGFSGAAPDVGYLEGSGGPSSPGRSNGAPTGVLDLGTTSTVASLTTNVNATCRYMFTPGIPYGSMTNTFTGGGGTSHTTTITGLTNGITRSLWVRCVATSDATLVNTTDFLIQFSVASPAPPARSNGSPSGILASGTTQITLAMTTDIVATCKYGTTASVAYASIANTFTTTNTLNHSSVITGLSAGAYTYYVRCTDGITPNTDDFIITFTIQGVSPAPQLIAYYRFDEANGTTAIDSATGVNPGVFVGSPAHITGQVNMAIRLNGIDQYMTRSPIVFGGGVLSDYTVALWAKKDPATACGLFQTVFANYSNFGVGGTADSFQIDCDGAGNYRLNASGSYTIGPVISNWQFLTVVKSGTTLRTYIDGALTHTYAIGSTESNNFRDFLVGVNRAGNIFYKGDIDEVRVYNSALDAVAIQQLFGNPGTPIAPSNLAASRTPGIDLINLVWTDNSTNETGFEVHISQDGNAFILSDIPLPADTTTLSYAPATPGANYCHTVRAVNAVGQSAYTAPACIISPPSNVSNIATAAGDTAVTITWTNPALDFSQVLILRSLVESEIELNKGTLNWAWTPNPGSTADGWNVKCGTAPGVYSRTSQVLSATARSIALTTALGSAGHWYCVVTAYANTQTGLVEGTTSNEVNFTALTASAIRPTDGINYTVGNTIDNSTVRYISNGATFTDTGLTNGVQYFYKLFVRDALGNYSSGSIAQSATAVAPPGGITPGVGAVLSLGTTINLGVPLNLGVK